MSESKGDKDPFLMTNWWGKKFLVFGAILILLTGVIVIWFDRTNDDEFNLQYQFPKDTTPVSIEIPGDTVNKQ